MTDKRKPILCLDFDGVLHSYTSGWRGAREIPDLPVEGAMDFLCGATSIFDVCIFSSRSRYFGGRRAMRRWLLKHLTEYHGGLPGADRVLSKLRFPLFKPPAFLTIDDRAITFKGVFPEPTELLDFQPWTKKGVSRT